VSYVTNFLLVVDVALQLALLFLLLRGPYRRYIALFVYSLVVLGATTVETLASHLSPGDPSLYRKVYWSDEVIVDLLLFLLVISLTSLAMEGNPLRAKTSRILAGIVAAALILPFVLFNPPLFTSPTHWNLAWGRWFNSTSQMLNFGAAIMNLGLWSALLTSRKRDSQLLKVSIGVGVAVAGQAIGFGIRRFTADGSTMREFPDLFMSLTHVLSVFIWCSAFFSRRPAAPETEQLQPGLRP
jgi:hypothetical protein